MKYTARRTSDWYGAVNGGLCRGPVERASASTATGLRHLYVFRDVKPRVDEIVLFITGSRHIDRNAGKKARDAIRLKAGLKPSIARYNQHSLYS